MRVPNCLWGKQHLFKRALHGTIECVYCGLTVTEGGSMIDPPNYLSEEIEDEPDTEPTCEDVSWYEPDDPDGSSWMDRNAPHAG